MSYDSLRAAVVDLERTGQLARIEEEIDPHLEAAELQRRVFRAGGPALYFARVKGSRFPMVSNVFGTMSRVRFLFRDSLDGVRLLVDAKLDPRELMRHLGRAFGLPLVATNLMPKMVSDGPVLAQSIRISDLPRLVSWPDDGGPFLTLPQVFTEDPDAPGVRHSNLGMYRVQLSGNEYVTDREVGLHYQIHRGIGVHHATAIRRKERLPVAVFLGGPPAMAVAAVMPLPEGLPEIAFAGALNRRRVRMIAGAPSIHAEADVCIRGYVEPHETKPEGPFGDHLGYYSNRHDFPVLHVESVHARNDAIIPFTTVGRPPQEDTMFGALIHELTGPLVPSVLPGVKEVNAVDEAGVHPLLLAIGSERYVPYASREKPRQPMELLTQANAILGQGQMSLAKYLLIVAGEDDPTITTHDLPRFFRHLLERIDPSRDLHFHTHTTIDTLDYSGTGLNSGSKVVIAACGEKRRELATQVPRELALPDGIGEPRVCLPGVLALRGRPFDGRRHDLQALTASSSLTKSLEGFPLLVLVDDSDFCARSLANFLWTTFTRSNPAADIHGVDSFTEDKAWGCRGPLVIDARAKPHHAPGLFEDASVTRKIDDVILRNPALRGALSRTSSANRPIGRRPASERASCPSLSRASFVPHCGVANASEETFPEHPTGYRVALEQWA